MTRVTLELMVTSNSICGSAGWGKGPSRPFYGWLELSSLLDRARHDASADEDEDPQFDGRPRR